MNNFIFENKTKVYFGKGGVKEYLGCLLKQYGPTVILAYGGGSIKKNGVYDEVTGILNAQGKKVIEFSGIMPNPTYKKAQEGAKLAREHHVDLILAVGGGSVSDCCKIVSAQAKLDEDIWDMEMVKHTFPSQFIPLGTIVTVFGTGSEMNAGAVITHEEKKLKSGIFGAQADFAFLDPTYTLSVPFGQVISGAFDTLSHAMETYFGKPDENNLSDDLGEAVMRSVIRNIRVLMQDHDNYEARSELAWASAMAENGVLKIGKVTDFQAHQIEHQLGAYTGCNHGRPQNGPAHIPESPAAPDDSAPLHRGSGARKRSLRAGRSDPAESRECRAGPAFRRRARERSESAPRCRGADAA